MADSQQAPFNTILEDSMSSASKSTPPRKNGAHPAALPKARGRPPKVKAEATLPKLPARPVTKPIATNWFRLGYLIHDVSRLRRTLIDQQMKPDGITRSQWWVLANLSRHGNDGIMSSELAKLLDVGKVTLGGLIDRLELAGYVYRRADKTDRRAKHIFITDSGYELTKKMGKVIEVLNQRICVGMTEDEIKTTEFNLLRLKSNIREMLNGDFGPDVKPGDD
jgi:MarR family transcriptional regulator for hemolysin